MISRHPLQLLQLLRTSSEISGDPSRASFQQRGARGSDCPTDCATHVRCPGPQFTASALAAEGGGIDVAGSGADDLQSGTASQLERSAFSESEQSEGSPSLRRVTGTAPLISNSFYFVIPT